MVNPKPDTAQQNAQTALPFKWAFLFLLSLLLNQGLAQVQWEVNSQAGWESADAANEHIIIRNGFLYPTQDSAIFSTALKKFDRPQKLTSITLKQSPQWDNWQAIPKVIPKEAADAPVLIPVSDGQYWLLSKLKGDTANGYHAWFSDDMKTWKHYGPVSTLANKWVTSAEYMDGKFYIYYDYPNDEDPHLLIDTDLTDGQQGKEMGMVFNDPSHGSDMSIFRDEDGTFHLIYEDWSPLNPRKHSWDSPLAGHADSPDGINGFEPHEFPFPIDERTTPTGKVIPYEPHSNQLIPGKDLSPYEYEEHQGPQDAFGDYTTIKVGDQYYLFCDYDPHEEGKSMRVGRWRSSDINNPFIWDGEIGEGFHPDPTVGFAEGRFYLLVQRHNQDFVSEGPWIDGVEVRAGADTSNDGVIDTWTSFTSVKETYAQKPGFTRVIDALPARLETGALPAGYAFKIEFRLTSKNEVFPIIDSFNARFQ